MRRVPIPHDCSAPWTASDQQVQALEGLHLDPLRGVDPDQAVAHDQCPFAVAAGMLELCLELAKPGCGGGLAGTACRSGPAAPGRIRSGHLTHPVHL
jgi:hypothetical protein